MKRWKRLYFLISVLSFLICWAGAASAQTITQSYESDAKLQRGMIVGLQEGEDGKVEAINNTRSDDTYGVVVTGNDAVISISSASQKVYVALNGKNDVLVSDLNGKIETGDYISVSSVSGIGMKSDSSQSTVIGRALNDFNGIKDERFLSRVTVKDGVGKKSSISVGRISVDISIAENPLEKDVDAPFVLRKVGEIVAGEPVSGPKLYLALGLLILATGVSGGIMYSAVRSGIISIGRNPLSKKSISRSIFQMILVAFIIFFSALMGVYLILKI